MQRAQECTEGKGREGRPYYRSHRTLLLFLSTKAKGGERAASAAELWLWANSYLTRSYIRDVIKTPYVHVHTGGI